MCRCARASRSDTACVGTGKDRRDDCGIKDVATRPACSTSQGHQGSRSGGVCFDHLQDVQRVNDATHDATNSRAIVQKHARSS